MKIIRALSVMTCALLLHANGQAEEILIDDFSTNQGPVSDLVVGGGGSSSQIISGGGDILGEYRDIYVEEVDNGVDPTKAADDPTLGIHVQVSSGRFSATLDDLVKAYAVVTYDGANEVGGNWQTGVDVDGLGGDDWTGTIGFQFEAVSNDIVAPVQLIVWTNDSGDGVTFVKHVMDYDTLGDINGDGLYDAFFSVDGFADAGSINWASVGAFQAVFNLDTTGDLSHSKVSVDLSLARATAVQAPEPAALSMFGAGVLMLGFVGYRRRKDQ
ncbi:hypothetical protein ACOMICROBIO_FLGHMIGD_03608 [Vibrio sp. B1FLJ16]|uniref:PEP-CTERM sorting domain-containing protein n=1 Tax=Vibrio sp. B1FLJ16 TaxID=2751178 RepID=UPI0015F552B0|nr:PEP-CTERM sorting domain-containing protein [Vibrio sp. B1FLJ16]CAD7818095.1 hypothetical protein ACOMICROBIO_FLGHMIGD_03608 [Vibrio sp. B1FLJ16]CAE6933316.1 hypothetical protein ACOMICROBIO_FLGHMIGD_03608 [Vibrio sp. B1FLJ16]